MEDVCRPPNYCSYCLLRMKKSALRSGDTLKANQLAAVIDERKSLSARNSSPAPLKIDLSSIRGKIQIDLDDTVGSFEHDMRVALANLENLTYEQAMIRYPATHKHGLADWWEGDEDAAWDAYVRAEEAGLLYHSQPVREGARDVINWLNRQTDGRVEFLTARPEAFGQMSAKWLKENVGIDFNPKVSHSNAKHEFEDFEVMIDDSVPHINAIIAPDAPHGPRKTIFMTRARNDHRVPDSEHVHRAWSWKDIKQIFNMEET